jgi:hypothetical protein
VARRSLPVTGVVTTLAGLALLGWLVWTAGPREILSGFRQVGWGLLAIIGLAGARFAVRAAAWRTCLEPPHTLRLSDAFTAVVSGDALGNATPFGPIVGEPAKVAFVRTRVPLGAAFTALAIENVFYTLSVAAMIAAGTIALLLRGSLDSAFVADRLLAAGIYPEHLRLAAEIAIGAVIVLYVAAAWALWRKPALLSRSIALVGRFWHSPRLQTRMDKLRRLEHDIYSFASRRRQAVGPLVALEILFHALGVAEVHLTLWLLLGEPPPLVTSFVLETVNRLITVVFKFVPMQVGVNEGGTVLATQILGMTAQAGLTLAIIRRARVLVWQLTGTALLVRHGLTTRRILDDAELTQSGKA